MFRCVKKQKKIHPDMEKGCKNLNSEISSRIFLNFLFCPLISRKFPNFKIKFQSQNGERNFLIYFTERQWKYFVQVQTCKKPLQTEYISGLKRFQNVFFCSVGCANCFASKWKDAKRKRAFTPSRLY